MEKLLFTGNLFHPNEQDPFAAEKLNFIINGPKIIGIPLREIRKNIKIYENSLIGNALS